MKSRTMLPMTSTTTAPKRGVLASFGFLLISMMLSAQALAVPAAPTIDSVADGIGQATITFTPGADNGSPIIGYRYIKDDGNSISTILGETGRYPSGIAVDAAGNVYTANSDKNNVSKITPDGTSTILGETGNFPNGIALDAAGNVYTSNQGTNNVSKITPAGDSTILAETAEGSLPLGIAIDAAGNVYTANYNSNNVSKITPDGTSTILGETGSSPIAIAVDAAGNVYTANRGLFNVSKITPNGDSTILGKTGEQPRGIAVDAAGNVYTANKNSNNVTKITPAGDSTIFGTTGKEPAGITIDAAGNVYTANWKSNNVSKITPNGISTIFGTTGRKPYGIALDAAGNVYTSNEDSNNVSKIAPAGASYPATGDASPITITGLTNGTDYLISLIAVNEAGESVASNSVLAAPGMAPDAPTIDSIAPGNGQATVAFTPGADNGSPITSYRVSCEGEGGRYADGAASPITVSGFYPDYPYQCVVFALNIIGTSPASATSEPFVVGAPATVVPPPSGTPPPTYGTPPPSTDTPPSSATPVPTSPLWLLGIMAGLLSLVGFRKLRKA
jgi:sugar lactone lactonase YvrE